MNDEKIDTFTSNIHRTKKNKIMERGWRWNACQLESSIGTITITCEFNKYCLLFVKAVAGASAGGLNIPHVSIRHSHSDLAPSTPWQWVDVFHVFALVRVVASREYHQRIFPLAAKCSPSLDPVQNKRPVKTFRNDSLQSTCTLQLTISPSRTTFSPRIMKIPLGMSPYSLPTWILSIVLCSTKFANWSTLRKYPINVRPSRSKTISFSGIPPTMDE